MLFAIVVSFECRVRCRAVRTCVPVAPLEVTHRLCNIASACSCAYHVVFTCFKVFPLVQLSSDYSLPICVIDFCPGLSMADCSVCKKTSEKARNKIVCHDCKRVCHSGCVNLSKDDIDYIVTENQVWRCPPCTQTRRRSMAENTSAEDKEGNLSKIISMLDEAAADRKRIEVDISKSFDFVHESIREQKIALKAQDEKLSEYLKLIESLRTENAALKKRVTDLEARIDDNEQYMRSNSLEIQGIPEDKAEDVHELVRKVGVALDVKISREDIDTCHRLGRRPGSAGPAGIIVKMVRRDVKHLLLEKRRVKRNFNTSDIGFTQLANPIYLNESLAPSRRKLYAAARVAKREKDYTYLWVRNGKIFMRKNQGDPVIIISSFDQINKLK